MNAAHVHLMLNHVPILGTFFGLALLAAGFWRRSAELKRAALVTFLVSSFFAVPVYLTGEPAEEVVGPLPGVSHPLIEQHEDAAAAAFTGMVAVGLVALTGLVLGCRGRALPGWFFAGLLLAAVVVAALMVWTGSLGGKIRHTEIRAGAAQAERANHD